MLLCVKWRNRKLHNTLERVPQHPINKCLTVALHKLCQAQTKLIYTRQDKNPAVRMEKLCLTVSLPVCRPRGLKEHVQTQIRLKDSITVQIIKYY